MMIVLLSHGSSEYWWRVTLVDVRNLVHVDHQSPGSCSESWTANQLAVPV